MDYALYTNEEIINEYKDVLVRGKFAFPPKAIESILNKVIQDGLSAERVQSLEVFPDADDAVFYEVAISKDDAYLVTGNTKHFPKNPIVVTPAETATETAKEGVPAKEVILEEPKTEVKPKSRLKEFVDKHALLVALVIIILCLDLVFILLDFLISWLRNY